MKRMLFLSLIVSSYSFAGGLEEPAKKQELPTPATSETTKKVTDEACKPGTTMTTGCGDNVGTKVVCACEPKECKPGKTVEKIKYVKGPIQYVEKKIVVPGKTPPPKTVYVDKPIYIEKPAKPAPASNGSDRNIGVAVMAGIGPDGIRPYRYGDEYKAEVGKGILVGIDVDYTFLEKFYVGAIYINNDTTMGKLGFRF